MESPDSRDRRSVLRALGAAAALPALPTVAAGSTVQDDYGPVGRVEVAGTTEAVVAGDVAYLATTTGFATVDVSDPEAPTVLAERRDPLADREGGPMRQIYDVKVDGDRLLVAGPANAQAGVLNALALYDVSDPAAPELLNAYETETANHNVFLLDGLAYRPSNGINGRRGTNPLVIVDVAAGEEVGRWSLADVSEAWSEVPTSLQVLHDVYVQDGVAYLAHWDAGTWMVDVSDPASPSAIGRVRGRSPEELRDAGNAEYVQPPGNDHYVAVNDDASVLGVGMESWDAVPGDDVGGPSGVELFDVSDPTDPERLTTIAPPPTDRPTYDGVWTTSHNFEFAGDRLYTSWYRGGVKVFDVSDPARPGVLREWADRESTSVWTARTLTPGETFVASAENHTGDEGLFNGLLVFPDAPAGERSTRTQTPVPTDGSTDGPAADGTTEPSTAAETDGPDATTVSPPGSPSGPGTDTTTASDGSSGSGPGFGVAAGLAGTGLAAWRLLAGRDGEE